MSKGAGNIHGLAATLRKLEEEAASGPCNLHPDRPSVGFISGWDNHPKGVCETCALYGAKHGYTVHRRDPMILVLDCDSGCSSLNDCDGSCEGQPGRRV